MPYKDTDKQREYQKNWKRAKREWLWELKKTLSCSKCGATHPAIIQFHHDGEKEMQISDMIDRNYSKDRIMAEIKRCEVLCANCHAILHYELGYPVDTKPQNRVSNSRVE